MLNEHRAQRLAPVGAFLLISVWGSIVAGSALAQDGEPAARFGETLDIDLVLLDVVAVDDDGNFVTDLGRDEVTVREDGMAVTLESFEAPASRPSNRPVATPNEPWPPTPPSPTPPTGTDDLRLVVFIDQAHIGAARRDAFVRDLWDFLEREIPPETPILVASYGPNLSLLTGFTTDRDAIHAGLNEALRAPALGTMAALDQRQAIRAIQQRQREAMETPHDLPCSAELGTTASQFASQAYDLTVSAISGLRGLIATLGGLDGSKALLHVSEGVPLVPGQPIIEYTIALCDGSGAQQGVQYAMDALVHPQHFAMVNPSQLRMDLTRFSVEDDLMRVAELATANRVRLFTFQVAAPSSGADVSEGPGKVTTSFARFQETRNAEDSLFVLADETGGRAFLSGVRLDRDLDTVIGQLRSSYSLAYVAPAGRDGKAHRIEVDTTRPGVRILHPSHRTSKTLDDEVQERILAAVHYDVTSELPGAELDITRSRPDGPRSRARIRLPVDRVTFALPDGSRQGVITLFLTAIDETGASLGLRRHTHSVLVPPGDPSPSVVLEVDMGRDLTAYRVVAAVRSELQDGIFTLLREPTTKRD